MNKTININLGGFFFHIDETAFQKLKRYLDAVSKSLSDDPQGKNEIIADIEARISELLSERITDARQVVNEGDIEEIIKIMGQPEDYAEAEESFDTAYTYQHKKATSKKLFRDGDDKFLGGVASGIGHYLGIDTIWIRLAFILLALSGFSILAYIILWILLPEAQTTAEKLQMEGEPVNIDNIEKKIREEFVYFSEKFKDGASELGDKISSADFEKMRKKTSSGLQDFLDALGKIVLAIFKIVGKFIGVLLLIIAGAVLISLLIAGFSLGSFEILGVANNFVKFPPSFYDSILPMWLLSSLLFIAIAIPFLILFILGLRIISSSIKRISKTTSLTLLGIWIVAILGLGFNGIEQLSKSAYQGREFVKNKLNFVANDTITLKMKNDDTIYYQHNFRRKTEHEVVLVDNKEKLYSSYVRVNIKPSDDDKTYLEIRKQSEGRNRKKAKINAEKLEYNYNIDNKTLDLNGYFLSDYKNYNKNEMISVTLFLPKNVTVFFNNSTRHFIYDIENTHNIHDRDMIDHHFKMTVKGLKCTDCILEGDTIDEENNTQSNL